MNIISFNLSQTTHVELALYDILGKMVKTILTVQQINSGEHTYTVDLRAGEGHIPLQAECGGMIKSKIVVKEQDSSIRVR